MENEKISRWTWDIFRWIRPHHIIKTFKHPKRAIREIKYRYTFTSKARFAVDLLSVPRNLVSSVLNELHSSDLPSTLESQIERHPASSGRGPMGDEAELLYLCVRLARPALVVETGVGAGFSTTFILQALKKNNHGKLYSIDFYKDDERCGWIIPTDLKNRWKLIRGLSRQALNPLLEQLGSIDVFMHDSDHSYENMMTEFRTVWPFLKSGGIFLAHDVGRNDALFDFCKEVNFSWWRARTYPVLAGLRKT
jgi:predicted O-methyltransferase YrrM